MWAISSLLFLPSFYHILLHYFRQAVLGIPTRQKSLLKWLTLAIPLTEIGIGIMSISGFWPTLINSLLFLLMSSFTIVVSIALLKKLHIECRCFGSLSDSQFSRKGLARSIFLTFLAAVVFWSSDFSSSYIGGSLGPPILLIAGYIVFAVVVMQATQTITLLKEEIS
jgi:hypothetical protein